MRGDGRAEELFQLRKVYLPYEEGRATFQKKVNAWQGQQAVVVKMSYKYPSHLKQHINYILREGATQGEGLFNADRDVTKKEASRKIRGEKRHFRIILSPENAHKLDMKKYTREVMKRYEKDLGYTLEWNAVCHKNTDNPHVHVVIRGKDKTGLEVRFLKEFIKYGARSMASREATQELGAPSITDTYGLETMSKSNRFTILDRQLQNMKKIKYSILSHHLKKRVNELAKKDLAYIGVGGNVRIVRNLKQKIYERNSIDISQGKAQEHTKGENYGRI